VEDLGNICAREDVFFDSKGSEATSVRRAARGSTEIGYSSVSFISGLSRSGAYLAAEIIAKPRYVWFILIPAASQFTSADH
jgi:hypothetical protein